MNKMLSLTNFQISEAIYKVDIVADEPDLMESYGVTEAEVDFLLSKLKDAKNLGNRLSAAPVSLTEAETKLVYGELEDVYVTAHANYEHMSCADERSCYTRMLNALTRIRKYAAECGYSYN